MDSRDDAEHEVEADAVAGLDAWRNRFAADARHPHLAVWFVVEAVVQVVGQLAVDADRLQPMHHGVA
jgi:hypothetical protein